ncbi:hypothetical protein GCM10010168_40920 [Actinoplanes ianthinogenes]|uniref:WD40 repeat protein n=1 Tax=Actinoplanes ianthinogenes TaxID=122358 RepID=A0ABN6CGD8_9ACTN|nr:hypothetical protein [Actinoplanes ianthinogenes]BCJ43599.1 hypothetical protein Aiant_42560 [Actinoplanes ianthinogenes]GGR18958.1 hypothetical protein GCM10010168_40920 [Actinoplanes ianthinogenes]
MTRTANDLLRTTVRDLAGEAGAPHAFAARALAAGQRRRRLRHTVVSVAAAVLVGVTAAVPYTLTHRHAPAPPAAVAADLGIPPFDPQQAYALPGGARLVGAFRYGSSGDTATLVLPPGSAGYRSISGFTGSLNVAPTGRYALVERLEAEHPHLVEVTTGREWTLPYPIATAAVWSSDGTRLLVTRETGFSVVDPATGQAVDHDIDPGETRCLNRCQFTWLAGGKQVALPQAVARNSEAPQVTGLAIFDAGTGELLRTIPVTAAPLGRDAWSPDGRLVLTLDTGKIGHVSIADAATGRVLGSLPAETAVFRPDGTVLATDRKKVTWYAADGQPIETLTLPDGLAGRQLTFGR